MHVPTPLLRTNADPFNSLPKLQALRLRSSAFATVAAGLSCNVTVAGTGDTWFTVAHTNSVDVVELMRANQAIDRSLMPGDKLFLPPCHGGGMLSTYPFSVKEIHCSHVRLRQHAYLPLVNLRPYVHQ